jgi:hypothetical protein
MAERYKPHQFTPDKQPETRGRKKGIPNRTTAMIKACLEGSAQALGRLEPVYGTYVWKGTGKKRERKFVISSRPIGPMIGHRSTGEGGMQGYLESMGVLYPRDYLQGLLKLLPHQIKASVDHTHQHDVTVTTRFKDVDPSKLSSSELQSMLREALSLTKPLAEPPKLLELQAEDVEEEAA